MAAANNKPVKRKRATPTRKQAVKKDQKKIDDSKIINQALEFRKAGLTWNQISEQMNIPAKSIWTKVHKYLDELVAEPTEQMRQLHYERYNFMLSRLWPGVINGDTSSVNQALNTMARIEKLYGLEAPTKTESVNVHIDPSKMVIGGTEEEYVEGMAGMAAQIDPALLAKIPPHLRGNVVDVDAIEESE